MKRILKSQGDYCGGYHQTLRDNYWKECRIVGDQRSSEDAVRNQSCFPQAWTSQAKSTRLYWIRSTRKQGGGTWDIIVLGVSDMVSNFRSIPIEIRELNSLIWLSFVTVLSRYLLERTVVTVLQRETKTKLNEWDTFCEVKILNSVRSAELNGPWPTSHYFNISVRLGEQDTRWSCCKYVM